ncbi:MAG: AMP-binding protein, partial [Alphaproteobacteria bacterium]
GMPVNLFHRWAAETDAHVLYLRAPVAAGFDDGIPGVGSDFPALVEFVRGVADVLEVAEIGVYGNSMGGFASIRLGLDVGARRMISAAGVAGMLRPGVRTLPTAAERQRGRQLLVDRLAPGLRAAAGRVEVLCIFSRENTGDRDDAAALAGLPGVRLSGLERAHHNVGRHLAIDGRLGQLLAWVSGHPRSRWARADHTRREPGTKIVPRRRLRALPGKPLAGGFADPVEAIDRLALADPRARSVLAADGSVDRGTLVAGSWALARRLPADDPSPVAFLGDFAASYVAAMIACRRLRRPFVPLDPGTSVLRMEQVLLSSGATDLVLASAGPRPQFPLRSIRTTIFDWADARDDGDAPVVDRPDEAAFVVYTSGSTGVPKGVAHPPRTAASFAALERGELDLRAGDRVVVVSPPGLVGAPVTSLAALAAGAELLAVGEGRTIGDMIGLVGREQATHLVGYVGLMRALASHAGAAEAFARVRAIQVYGDAVGVEDLAALRAPMMPDGRVCLIYGLTECVTMTLWTPPPDFSAPGGRLPLGLPTDGVELWLDPSDGADEGELLATGPRLMTGYWRDDAATNARFVPHPDDPARRLFATGDIVRLRADGMLDFVGRRDNLVKLRGRRIELEDIEAAARRLPGVTGAGVVARRGARATIDSLALHVAGGADGEAVRSGLAATLADYMVPAHVISGANLPLTATGKIDRVRLGEIDRRLRDRMGEEAGGAEGLWPDPLARRIAAIIADEAGVEVISPEAAAVDAGMDSLQAVNVALRIEKQFAVSIAPEELLGRRLFGDIVGEIAARAMG